MNRLLQSLDSNTVTQNGAFAKSTTGSYLLDFFANGAAYRGRPYEDILNLFKAAFKENPLYAIKALFYFRDVRGGQGERRIFRTIIQYLANSGNVELVASLIPHVPFFGRWDDLLVFEGTPLQAKAFQYFADQLKADYSAMDNANASISLAGKWAPSENASSTSTRLLAQVLRGYTGLDSRGYRKMLSTLREKIRVVERDMCAGEWENIDFSTVPSCASLLYRKAFSKRQPVRYSDFHAKVKKGEVKINATALYPYDVIRPILNCGMHKVGDKYFPTANTAVQVDVLDNLWNALPDYMGENTHNGLVVVDTSGSMSKSNGLPIQVAVSLGIYFAERNKGMFKDYFVTFSDVPKLQKINGANIVEKVANLVKTDWNASTNIRSVFNLILSRAVQEGLTQEDMPSSVYIISDMEFNIATKNNDLSNFEAIRADYANAGFKMPKLVFWNVDSKTNQVAARKNDENVVLVSGCSPSILKHLLSGKEDQKITPFDKMMETLDSERYSVVTI